MKRIIAGLVITLVLSVLPPPKITVRNPKMLYAAAMYKTAVGDTDSALRLVQRAEAAQQSRGAVHTKDLHAAVRSVIAFIL